MAQGAAQRDGGVAATVVYGRFRLDAEGASSVRLAGSFNGWEPNVELTELDYSSQTFFLGFDVSNPNPFTLPVSSVSYGVELDGLRFATGETQGGFVVPANGDGNFAISVQLDLLRTSPRLLHTVRDGVLRDIPYELKGSLGVDIPAAKPVRFQTNGQVRLLASQR